MQILFVTKYMCCMSRPSVLLCTTFPSPLATTYHIEIGSRQSAKRQTLVHSTSGVWPIVTAMRMLLLLSLLSAAATSAFDMGQTPKDGQGMALSASDKLLVPFIRSRVAFMTAQIRQSCALANPGNPVPTACQCSQPQGSNHEEAANTIVPERPTRHSARLLKDCKPTSCSCANQKHVPIRVPPPPRRAPPAKDVQDELLKLAFPN